ncbi:MAG: sodium:alanine symporter family protein [Parachlamydiales bacterium]|jgi:AGCS family alanine or glycine:cation symporter
MLIIHWLELLNSWLWSGPLLLLLFGTGLYLTIILKGFQFRYLGYAFRAAIAKQQTQAKGDISHFEALMTSLAGAIGTGSIVGVATAVAVGGLGAIFWMWVTALLGMATKYAESLLAVKYRHMDARGEMIGGPMQYIENGLGWKKFAILFAVLGVIATFGTGNMVQVNAIVEGVGHVWNINPLWTGLVVLVFTGLVVIGGIRSIGHVAAVLVPLMATFYIIAALIVIGAHIEHIPAALQHIVSSAFTGQAAIGAFTGSTVVLALQLGISNSIFSNESGLGISTIAAAAAKTDSPARQGMITMTGALISTMIVCTMTGLVLSVTEVLGATTLEGQMLNGASMAITAFKKTITGGEYVVAIGLILFAYTTIIAWAYYGEKCFEYLFGEKWIYFYRIIYILVILPGAILDLETVWLVANVANALMVIPNLIAVLGLSKVVVSETNKLIEETK